MQGKGDMGIRAVSSRTIVVALVASTVFVFNVHHVAAGHPGDEAGFVEVRPVVDCSAKGAEKMRLASNDKLYCLGRQVIISTKDIDGAGIDSVSDHGAFDMFVKLKRDASKRLSVFTSSHLNARIGIVVDKTLVSVPMIKNALPANSSFLVVEFFRDRIAAAKLAASIWRTIRSR